MQAGAVAASINAGHADVSHWPESPGPRAEAIGWGALVDVTPVAAEVGFTCPVAMTRRTWNDCVLWTPEDTRARRVHQDQTARLRDVLWVLRCRASVKRDKPLRELLFDVYRVARCGIRRTPTTAWLQARIVPGDNGDPVVTVDGARLDPRLDLFNHSPTGFAWGYGGSGPAQLALAILADCLGDGLALERHQAFKWDVIGPLPIDRPWTLTEDVVRAWASLLERSQWVALFDADRDDYPLED